MQPLSGRVIVITGSGRGLGKAFVEDCCIKGAKIIIGEKNQEFGEKTYIELSEKGFDVYFIPLDVGDPDSINRFSERLSSKHQKIDGLVNNAALATGIWFFIFTTCAN